MAQRRLLQVLTLLSLSTLIVGVSGCSQGHGPTEPESLSSSAAPKSLSASPGRSHGGSGRGGSDDPAGDDHGGQGNGADDPAGDDHGGRNGGHRGDGNGGGNHGQQQRPPRAGELEGAVATVDPAANTVTLASGKRIVVNGQTQFDRRGDLFSLSKLADAVAAGKRARAEGRGALQADGSLLAKTIKVEIDGR
jgi:hypothetical protein